MLLKNQHPNNKSIMVAVLGEPNVGKSSLINHLLGFDLTAVSSRPQTTRNAYHCNFTVDHTEVVLVDTPGIHKASQEINKRMNQEAEEGKNGADLCLYLIDITRDPIIQFNHLFDRFGKETAEVGSPVWVVFTKSDLAEDVSLFPATKLLTLFQEKIPHAQKVFIVNTKKGDNMHLLTGAICDAALPGAHLYPDGSISNKNERFFAAEYIREQAFRILREELPYEMAVMIDEYKDFRDRREESRLTEDDIAEGANKVIAHIQATIIVNKTSQRAIVVGAKGSVIREIGSSAREKIESMVGGKVFLNLHVKVVPHWFKNNMMLEQLGLERTPDSRRVWRKRA